ncbi:MAG: hypothetical protein ACKVS9_12325 [Phycisphaerae bacterium]
MSHRRLLAAVVASAALLFGCAPSRVTIENYERVNDGMSQAEVESILGKPNKSEGGGFSLGDFDAGGRVMIWKDGEKRIIVTITGGKVILKVQKGL